jgi:hypothetical protein
MERISKIGTNSKNEKNYELEQILKMEQILKLEQISKMEQITNRKKFRKWNKLGIGTNFENCYFFKKLNKNFENWKKN